MVDFRAIVIPGIEEKQVEQFKRKGTFAESLRRSGERGDNTKSTERTSICLQELGNC